MRWPAVLLVVLASAWTATRVAGTEADSGLRSAMEARTRAHLTGDAGAVESSMADEYVQTDIFGRVQNKSEWLAEYFKPLAALIQAGQFRWDVWEEKDIQVRRCGDTAVVVGTLTLKGTGASPVPGRGWVASPNATLGPALLHFTRVWIKKDGRWLLAALHNATVPEAGPR